jgi:hypothetical protein
MSESLWMLGVDESVLFVRLLVSSDDDIINGIP